MILWRRVLKYLKSHVKSRNNNDKMNLILSYKRTLKDARVGYRIGLMSELWKFRSPQAWVLRHRWMEGRPASHPLQFWASPVVSNGNGWRPQGCYDPVRIRRRICSPFYSKQVQAELKTIEARAVRPPNPVSRKPHISLRHECRATAGRILPCHTRFLKFTLFQVISNIQP